MPGVLNEFKSYRMSCFVSYNFKVSCCLNDVLKAFFKVVRIHDVR